MVNYKHVRTGAIISEPDFRKLPFAERCKYIISMLPVTDNECRDNDDNDQSLLSAGIDLALSSSDFTPSNFDGFGGGDFGGSGAGSEW